MPVLSGIAGLRIYRTTFCFTSGDMQMRISEGLYDPSGAYKPIVVVAGIKWADYDSATVAG